MSNKAAVSPADKSLVFFNSELFSVVQMSKSFDDSKAFADAIPKKTYQEIIDNYNKAKQNEKESPAWLKSFIFEHFELPKHQEITLAESAPTLDAHIELLWNKLSKTADDNTEGSLLPLNEPYIVPGGRFQEIYYWDSYFTALGLIESGRVDLVESMLNNFIAIQSTYGCIPNGNRSYYLSRSQPPILAMMIEILLPYQQDEKAFIAKNIAALEAEHHYWMKGKSSLSNTVLQSQRVVSMPDGSLLNRYWDEQATPRPESYREDIELLTHLKAENSEDFYRNVRAACESGWDFSSRWLGTENTLESIRTTRIVPIDLNCLLYKLELTLTDFYLTLGQKDKSDQYAALASNRNDAIQRYLWDDSSSLFMDFDMDLRSTSAVKSLACVLPLFVNIATKEQASAAAIAIETIFLKSGGLVTTPEETGQQWDSPNGWAPLHWFAVQGLFNYGYKSLAEKVMHYWLTTCESYFSQTGKMMEKYDVCSQSNTAGGGEYDVQEGFGWTNGVYQAFSAYFKL